MNISSPRGPAMVVKKGSDIRNNESLPTPAPSFSLPSGRNASVPLPGSAGPAASEHPVRESASVPMPSGKTPVLTSTSQAKVDQVSLAAFRRLKTCLDTELEKKLKIQLAVMLEGDATCSYGTSTFFFAATETEQTLQIGVALGAGQGFRDRCDALQQAVRCVEQSRK